MSAPTLLWLRQDLRLQDHPALRAAIETGPVIPVYIWAPEEEGAWAPGGASRWWLHHSLVSLDEDLRRRGSQLVIRRGASLSTLRKLAAETGAKQVFWSRRYEPQAIARDTRIKTELQGDGLSVQSFNSALLFEPFELQTQAGQPFQVFTPFWRACLKRAEPAKPLAAPQSISSPSKWPGGETIDSLKLLPTIKWDTGFYKAWTPGESGARAELKKFLNEKMSEYPEARDYPAKPGTSRLSPHLHFGEISPRQIWHTTKQAGVGGRGSVAGEETFLKEVGWREFAHHLLFHFPHTVTTPLREKFAKFPWSSNKKWLKRWQKGQTGFPLVDAGLRELWATGWMHNRVRMIVASFLIKDLRIPWQRGAEWFWDTLVDADLASNTMGWQWTAGCGADAAPYYRVFNPTTQGEKFDESGTYIRRWVPELKELPNEWIHQPDEAPPLLLSSLGVELGKTYPRPIVNHAQAREDALAAWQQIR